MNKLQELIKQLNDVDGKIDALLAHDELTSEQRTEHDSLVAQRKKVKAAIEREKDRVAREEERDSLAADAAAADNRAAELARRKEIAGTGRLTEADEPETNDVPAERREAAQKAAKFVIPANVKRRSALKAFRDSRNGFSADERAYRFGMWAMATLTRQLPHRYAFPQATRFVSDQIAAVTSKDSSGHHFLIPTEFSSDIIDLREQYGVARRILRVVPMNSDTLSIPRREGGLTASFVAEGNAGNESNKNWGQITLVAKKLMVISRITNEVNEDAIINWGDDLAREISYAFANKEDECAFNGDGSSTYGGIVGIRPKLQNVDGAGTDSVGLITGAGNAYSELTLANFNSVVGVLPQYADTPNTHWTMHRSFFYTVCEKLVQAAGGTTATEVREGNRGRPIFLGYPVEFSQVYPSTEANSQVCCTLGDHSLGATMGDRSTESIEFSDQATVGGESLWERDEIGVRGRQRFDVNVHDVGNASAAGPIVGLQTLNT